MAAWQPSVWLSLSSPVCYLVNQILYVLTSALAYWFVHGHLHAHGHIHGQEETDPTQLLRLRVLRRLEQPDREKKTKAEQAVDLKIWRFKVIVCTCMPAIPSRADSS